MGVDIRVLTVKPGQVFVPEQVSCDGSTED